MRGMRWLLAAALLAWPAFGQAAELGQPEGQVVLTVAGDVGATNRGPYDDFEDGFFKHHERKFEKMAIERNEVIMVRCANVESLEYQGRKGCCPKPITCKPKTADTDAFPGPGMSRSRYDTAGLVVDPTVHKNVFSGDARFLSDAASGAWIIARNQENFQAVPPKLSDHTAGARLDGVLEREQSG